MVPYFTYGVKSGLKVVFWGSGRGMATFQADPSGCGLTTLDPSHSKGKTSNLNSVQEKVVFQLSLYNNIHIIYIDYIENMDVFGIREGKKRF